MLLGNDIGGVNGPGAALLALSRGASYVILKATEGVSWNDPEHATFVSQVRKAGKRVGHYHYAWPLNDPLTEAKHFLAVANPQPGDVVMLDLEKNDDGASWARRVTYALAFLAYVKAVTKASPFIYLNGSWIDGLRGAATPAQWAQLTSYPLAYAHYSFTPGVLDFRAAEWPTWTLHQYTDIGLDGDALNGDAVVWDKLAVPKPVVVPLVKKVVVAVVIAAGGAAGGVVAVHPAPVPAPPPIVKVVPTPTPKPVVTSCPAPVAPKPVVVAPKPVAPKPVVIAPAVVFYTVTSGDTLSGIAARYHTTVATLASVNGIRNVNMISVGLRLRVR